MTRVFGRFLSAFLILALALAPALLLTSCNGVNDDTPGTGMPTAPGGNGGQDTDPPLVSGVLAITPGDTTFSAVLPDGGSCADFDGETVYFWAVGGVPPYVWSNANHDLGRLTPIDESGDGTWRKVKYTAEECLRENSNDVLIVRDQAGATDSVSVKFSISGGQAAETLSISPAAASGIGGDVLTFNAIGGEPTYTWSSSNSRASFPDGRIGPEVRVTLNATGLTADAEVTLTLRDGSGQTATAVITIVVPTAP